jgi:hypothetical protein
MLAAASAWSGAAADFAKDVRPVLAEHCFKCHGEKRPKGDVRLDTLGHELVNAKEIETWQRVAAALADKVMPPEDEQQPADAQRMLVTGWIDAQLHAVAVRERNSPGPLRTRRLTAREYNFTLQDLFGVAASFAHTLPPEPISEQGYQNDVELLLMSPLQMEYYLEIARTAVGRYVVFEPEKSAPLRYHIQAEDVFYTTKDRYTTMNRAPRALDDAGWNATRTKSTSGPPQFSLPLFAFPPGELPATEELRASQPKLHQQYLPLHFVPPVGDLIVRVKVAGTPGRDGSLPRLRLDIGMAYGDGDGIDALRLGEVDITAPTNRPQVLEFRARLEDVPKPKPGDEIESLFDMVQLFFHNVARDERALYDLGIGSVERPDSPDVAKNAKRRQAAEKKQVEVRQQIGRMTAAGVNRLHLDAIELEMIPRAGPTDQPRWQVDMALARRGKDGPRAAAEEFLKRFLPAAYRRPVTDVELAEKLALFDRLAADGKVTFESSLRETLVSVLASPNFLLLETAIDDAPRSPTPHQLAARLSYLLWGTMPDDALRRRAGDGSLARRDVYASEAARLLDDPRAQRFLEDFCRQWLRLDKFALVAVNPEYFPGYDDDFGDITQQEPLALFREVFASRASALDLLAPRYALLNDRLASHYGLEPVRGGDLRKVSLPADTLRGGLLSHASLLTMNSDGVDSHPIRRGVWVVDRLLGRPPPPPPPNIPDLDETDPDLRGLSLKQRIEKHREPGSCRDCHQRFDPYGIALENFDAIGRWREQVRVRHDGKDTFSPVDSVVTMTPGTTVRGAGELQRYLVEEHGEAFTRALVHHLLTYALGRKPGLGDQLEAREIHARFARSGFQLRELVLAVVESDAFRR